MEEQDKFIGEVECEITEEKDNIIISMSIDELKKIMSRI